MAPANVTNANVISPTLWVGTNAGTVYIHTITIPEKEKRSEEEVTAQLAKEIQLKHRAPVIYVQVIDSTGKPVSSSLPLATAIVEQPPPSIPVEGEAAPVSPPVTSPAKSIAKVPAANYRVLIVSEEQFKLFQLPSLKPDRKSKLTAHEGARARKVNISKFLAKSLEDNHVEHCLTCLSNQGDVSVYDLTDLKRQTSSNLIKKEDVHGIASLFFTAESEGLFLHSPSEFQRFSLSVRRVLIPTGIVEIPEGVIRPVVESVVVPENIAPVADEPVETEKAPEEAVTGTESSASPIVDSESIAAAVAEAALAPVVEAPVVQEAIESVMGPEASATVESIPSTEPDESESNFESLVHQELVGLVDSGSDFPSLVPQQDIVNDAPAPTNGHHNGLNGDNGDGLSEEINGTNGASLNDTDISYATNDITIDSVRDFTYVSNNQLCMGHY